MAKETVKKETVSETSEISKDLKIEIIGMMADLWNQISEDVIINFENRTISQEDLIKIIMNGLSNYKQVSKPEMEKIARELFPAKRYSY